jgi:hypothetical protein
VCNNEHISVTCKILHPAKFIDDSLNQVAATSTTKVTKKAAPKMLAEA